MRRFTVGQDPDQINALKQEIEAWNARAAALQDEMKSVAQQNRRLSQEGQQMARNLQQLRSGRESQSISFKTSLLPWLTVGITVSLIAAALYIFWPTKRKKG